ncbi:methyltransferase [Candidatus Sumerlaeota bacterium]|nr:methyltransferase [Candidatus Sumerlaeota bacterium]
MRGRTVSALNSRALSIADLCGLPDLDFETGSPGMAPGHDSLALARYARVAARERVLDLGTGQGIVALMLAARETVHVIGVEREKRVLAAAQRNARRNAERLQGRVTWLCADLRSLSRNRDTMAPTETEGFFDLATMNPPFMRVGEGRISPDSARAAARQETHGVLVDWIEAAARALRRGGRLALIQRIARGDETLAALAEAGFSIVDRVRLSDTPGRKPGWLLATARKS